MFEGMETSDWVIATCTLLSPVFAVAATRIVDVLRDNRDRKNSVFVALMTTRRTQLNVDHVNALNRIELEFSNSPRVIAELRTYMNLMEERTPPLSRFEKDEVVKRAHRDAEDDLIKRRRRAFGSLVQAIGKKLGRNVDRHDIIEGGYYPDGWAEAEQLQLDNMRKLNDVLNWRQQFPIHLWRLARPIPLEGGIPAANEQDGSDDATPPPSGPRPGDPTSPFPPPPS